LVTAGEAAASAAVALVAVGRCAQQSAGCNRSMALALSDQFDERLIRHGDE
jgi:hypothetical protein